ncbi:hypothetical protein ABZ379_22900 [Streptomyces canus]|uniref:hypothetical protein n=1 Tax=Streptomyces canus TaxID=58343 RepID=UPI0033E2641F
MFSHQGPLFTIPETVVGLNPRQRPGPPVLLAAFTPAGLLRMGRRLAAPRDADSAADGDVGRHPEGGRGSGPRPLGPAYGAPCPPPADRHEGRAGRPAARSGHPRPVVDYARAAADAGVHELVVDFGQTAASLAERVDLVGRFIEGVHRG